MPERAIPKDQIPSVGLELSDTLREFTDSMTAYVMLSQAEQIIKSAKEQTLDHAIMKMDGKEMSVFGAKVTLRSIKEYEYDDSTLDKMESDAKELSEKIKARKEFMRLIKTEQADTATGEIVKPAKLTRHGTTIAVSFK
jgi:2-phospho-L-lactate transferase/gluconeogenesis factor (CofD/UPF0052 family)